MDIILASASPRRRELLEQIGIRDYRVVTSNADEHVDGPMEPGVLVELLSRRKAYAVREAAGSGAVIIAADTVVELDGAVLGKPKDAAEAAEMLRSLSGREHRVCTGVTVLCGTRAVTGHECTAVTFRALSEEEISRYVSTGEPMDKAGAYGIQGVGALLVERISGDYFNVMGLPVCRLAGMLRPFGVDALALAAGSQGTPPQP